MLIMVFGSVLCGAILGRYFKFFILILAYGPAMMMILINPPIIPQNPTRFCLEIVVLITGLHIGYLTGLFTRQIGASRTFQIIASAVHRRSGATML